MKHKSTDSSAIEVDGNIEIAVNARAKAIFGLKLKKLSVATTLGLAALAASLP